MPQDAQSSRTRELHGIAIRITLINSWNNTTYSCHIKSVPGIKCVHSCHKLARAKASISVRRGSPSKLFDNAVIQIDIDGDNAISVAVCRCSACKQTSDVTRRVKAHFLLRAAREQSSHVVFQMNVFSV